MGSIFQAPQTLSASGYEQPPAGGGFLVPMRPNIADFLSFIYGTVGILSTQLPYTSIYPQYALDQALGLVLEVSPRVAIQYTLAAYNCATHILYGITPDQGTWTNANGIKYFEAARSRDGFSLISPSTGLVASSSDEGTSNALATPDFARGLTIDQLDFFKTPWGRAYLSFIQAYGPTIVALT